MDDMQHVTMEIPAARVLASGLAGGQKLEVVEYDDGSLAITFAGAATPYRWPQEHTEACISAYLRMLRG